MKHKGAVMEYSEERMHDIMEAYNEYILSCDYICISRVCDHIATMPARRFWISEIWASKVVTAMMRGKSPYSKMRPLRKEMFQEIYNRVIQTRQQHPEWSISKCCETVVAQPAPKHYLSAGSIQIMICKEKKRRYEERKKRLQHCF